MKKEYAVLIFVIAVMAAYFLLATSIMMDDGFHYEGFAESLARGELDFKSFYGFQGLSFFAVPIWNYFGQSFWPNIYIYLLPFWVAMVLVFFINNKSFNLE